MAEGEHSQIITMDHSNAYLIPPGYKEHLSGLSDLAEKMIESVSEGRQFLFETQALSNTLEKLFGKHDYTKRAVIKKRSIPVGNRLKNLSEKRLKDVASQLKTLDPKFDIGDFLSKPFLRTNWKRKGGQIIDIISSKYPRAIKSDTLDREKYLTLIEEVLYVESDPLSDESKYLRWVKSDLGIHTSATDQAVEELPTRLGIKELATRLKYEEPDKDDQSKYLDQISVLAQKLKEKRTHLENVTKSLAIADWLQFIKEVKGNLYLVKVPDQEFLTEIEEYLKTEKDKLASGDSGTTAFDKSGALTIALPDLDRSSAWSSICACFGFVTTEESKQKLAQIIAQERR